MALELATDRAIHRTQVVASTLQACRFRFKDEAQLQHAIEQALHARGILARREVMLAAGNRVDFVVDGDIAVEVKIKGSFTHVAEQLQRYAASPTIACVLLATTRRQLLPMPETFHGKPVRCVLLKAA